MLVEHGRFPNEFLSLPFAERAVVAAFIEVKIQQDKKDAAKMNRR